MPQLTFASEQALAGYAGEVARSLRRIARDRALCIGLEGELGAGKTTWMRALLAALGHRGSVPSPTYTLVEIYPLDRLTICHLDLYRLSDESELEFLGIRDLLGQAATWLWVEWPRRAPGLLARCDLVMGLTWPPGGGAEGRRLEWRTGSGQGELIVPFLAPGKDATKL